jgi:hypothetical protein
LNRASRLIPPKIMMGIEMALYEMRERAIKIMTYSKF